MLTLKLVLRSLISHAQRSFILLTVVGTVSMLLFLFLSFSDGEIQNFKEGVMGIYDPPSDIRVYKEGAREAIDQGEESSVVNSLALKDGPRVQEALSQRPGIRQVFSPGTMVHQDILFKGEKIRNFFWRSLDPAQDTWLLNKIRVVEGGMPKTQEPLPQILLHKSSKSFVGAQVGDRLTLLGQTLFGQAVSQDVILAGYYAPEQDNPNLGTIGFISPSGYLMASGWNPGETLSLAVNLEKGQDKDQALKDLQAWSQEQNLGLTFWDFEKLPGDVFNIYTMIRVIILFMTVIILFIITVGVMNIVAVNLHDRRREIGTYYCLGAERPFLIRIYTLEILLANLLAAGVGVLLGLGIRAWINAMKITTEETGLQLVFGGSVFNLGFSGESVLWIILGTGILTVLTAVFTLGKALKVSPVSAIKEEEA